MSSKAIDNSSEFEVLLQLQQSTRTGSNSVKSLSKNLDFQPEFRLLNLVSDFLTKRQFFMMANNFQLAVPKAGDARYIAIFVLQRFVLFRKFHLLVQ